jgi:phosphate transport system protein
MTTQLDAELHALKKKFFTLANSVADLATLAFDGYKSGNKETITTVRAQEELIDSTEVEVEEDCLSIIARHQPVTRDLRYIASVLKINNDLERIGDLSVGISAKLTQFLEFEGSERCTLIYSLISEMHAHIITQVSQSIALIESENVTAVQDVFEMDRKIEALKVEAKRKVINQFKNSDDDIKTLINVLRVINHIERMSDLCTNIGEVIIYLVEGEISRHQNH